MSYLSEFRCTYCRWWRRMNNSKNLIFHKLISMFTKTCTFPKLTIFYRVSGMKKPNGIRPSRKLLGEQRGSFSPAMGTSGTRIMLLRITALWQTSIQPVQVVIREDTIRGPHPKTSNATSVTVHTTSNFAHKRKSKTICF